MKTVKVAAAVIYRKSADNTIEIFSAQRNHGSYTGYWEFPGGKIEAGETAQEAAVRELREELCADICIERHLMTAEFDYPDFHVQLECFVSTFVRDDFSLLEHAAYKWLPLEKLNSVKWLPADMQVLEKIRSTFINL